MDPVRLFFALDVDPGLLLYGSYDPWLVVLSVAIAVFSSSMALHAASQAREVQSAHIKRMILLAGSASLGCGVWAMHFIGMLSFALCTTVRYDVGTTVLSLLPSIGASWVALSLLSQERVTGRQLLISGVLVGAGIGAMHYAGMAAMNMSVQLRYDPWMFTLSIVVAVVLAVLALSIRFGMRTVLRRQSGAVINLLAGAVMGCAISGMHYTGMAAARFIGQPQGAEALSHVDTVPLALSISLVTVIATVLVAVAGGLAQYRHLIALLQSKENKLQAILDTAMDGLVVFDHKGTITMVNPGAGRIYGCNASDLVGRPVSCLVGGAVREYADTDLPGFMARLNHVVGTEFMAEGVRQDGQVIPLRMVLGKTEVEHKTLFLAYVTDFSERVAMESALRTSEAQFRTLIANIPGISYRCKPAKGWPMAFISDAVERITGFPAASFVGNQPAVRFASLVPDDDVARVLRTVQAATTDSRQFVLEFRLRHRDGSWRWMWGNGMLIMDEVGAIQFIDGVLLDMTERRQMEEDLRQAKEAAEAAVTARGNFLANMSHEIRTPMNAIIGFTEVALGSGELPPTQHKHLETVRRSARSLLHLLNDILDSAKLERGVLELESIDFSLRDLIAQLCAEQLVHAERKGLVVTHEVDASVERFVRGDPHRSRQVLANLIGNAVKFTERGRVTVRIHREGELIHVAVQDTGIGIAADRLDHIFDPFTQADASMSRRFGGTGLGTTISKQLVELMGGRIWVESTAGQGSTFHVTLPMQAGQEALALNENTPSLRPLSKLRVLVVDDVPQNIELLTMVLRHLGHQVVAARNGQEAVRLYEAQSFDVVLMDVQMPVMNGLEATRLIRSFEQTQGRRYTPILAVSANVLSQDRAAAIEAGMDGFATKPVDLPQLLTEMARVIGHDDDLVPVAPSAVISAFLPLDPEVVDQKRALSRWGEKEAFRGALERFVREHRDWLQDPRWVEAPRTASACDAEAHRIKGVASNLGLSLLAAMCEQVEYHLRNGGQSQMPELWAALRGAVQRTVDELSPCLPDERRDEPASDHPATQGGMSAADTRALAETVLSGLRRGEHLERELHAVLDSAAGCTSADRDAVLQAADNFEFETAAEALQRIVARLPVEGTSDVAG